MSAAVLLLALLAPAPPVRPVVRPPLAGVVWSLEWHDSHGLCELRPAGIWWCWWGGREWTGRYRLDGDTIHVEEWVPARNEWGTGGSPLRWSARMRPGTTEGRTAGDGSFTLRRPPK